MPEPTKFAEWHRMTHLGRGGQGEVFLAKKLPKQHGVPVSRIMKAVKDSGGFVMGEKEIGAKDLISIIREIVAEAAEADRAEVGALKILHPSTDRAATQKASDRMKQELDAQRKIRHSALVRILDARPEERWFVMEYFRRGTLDGNLERYRGDPSASLRALRAGGRGLRTSQEWLRAPRHQT
jgi:serine/threonine protein kinase